MMEIEIMSRRKLTEQQQRRVARQRQEQGADDMSAAMLLPGTVVSRHGASLVLIDTEGKYWPCHQRQHLGQLVAGDRVQWQKQDEHHGVVVTKLPRQSELMRQDKFGQQKSVAANITQVFIVCASLPLPSTLLIDQYLLATHLQQLKVVLLINKIDLLDQVKRIEDLAKLYQDVGLTVVMISASTNVGLATLKELMQDEVNVLVGQSGVGKSTIIQALLPEHEPRTGDVAEQTGLGRHTTSTARYYPLSQGGALIDTPGVRDFVLPISWEKLNVTMIEQSFPEISKLSTACQFRNCMHKDAKGCALEAAVSKGYMAASRLLSLQQFLETLKTEGFGKK